ncbi:hypothetical protein BJV78DRAFT_1285095 [Lactifluus subvellereus]|nr:hypothetical protein BJV78DRAFT_1285095 [Lactifluus subvellereus]
MSTIAPRTSGSPLGPLIFPENFGFDYPEADVVLRSCDSLEFRVLKLYILHSSPILCERVLTSLNSQASATGITADSKSDADASSLPVVQLSDTGAILFNLLTYIFPVPPILPPTVEQTMELLSVAQKYKMDVVLTHIRNHIAQREPPFIRDDTAFYIYSLAQKYGLRTEAVLAARLTLAFLPLTLDSLEDKLDMMPGACLHELWKYHERVKWDLTSDLEEFRTSHAKEALGDSTCQSLTASGIPTWLDHYIGNIGSAPASFDRTEFYMAFSSHVRGLGNKRGIGCTPCALRPRDETRAFWAALTSAVHRSMAKAESGLSLVGGTRSEGHVTSSSESSPPFQYSDMPSADVILRSADLVNFHVHKSALVTSSPFFSDMFSLPQPPNDEVVDGLPVVHVPEDAEVLNSLISMLYPVPPEIPHTDDNILALLGASQKYDMPTVQSSVRAEVRRKGLLSPKGAEAFRVYAIAYGKRLIPEMETTARLTLDYPMTFEFLGAALRSFEGWALRDLANFRQRCTDSLTSCFKSLSDHRNGPSRFWVGCPSPVPRFQTQPRNEGFSPIWLQELFGRRLRQLDGSTYTLNPSNLRKEYLVALQAHIHSQDCRFCAKMHALKGETFCAEVENMLAQARNVQYSFFKGIS